MVEALPEVRVKAPSDRGFRQTFPADPHNTFGPGLIGILDPPAEPTIFSLILNSVWISFRARARAEKVSDPLSCLHAKAAQDLCIVWGLNQCEVTPIKLRRCAVQQSVVVAMNWTSLRAAFSFLFISTEAFVTLFTTVLRVITFVFGWRCYTRSMKPCCWTMCGGCKPWTMKLRNTLSTLAWDTLWVSHSLVCLEGGANEPSVDDFLLRAAEVSC